jgi:hypothetical protein
MVPYNSQNTFLHRSVLKNYSVLPFIGRMDDIWGAYIQQFYHPESIIFTRSIPPSGFMAAPSPARTPSPI